jgi:hypothetical protein
MALIVVTVAIIGLLVAALAIYLFMVGVGLNRVAGNLGDCLQSVRTVAGQVEVVGPAIKRLNKTGAELSGAVPLMVEGAEGVAAKSVPSSAVLATAPAVPAPTGSTARTDAGAGVPGAADSPVGGGYLDM